MHKKSTSLVAPALAAGQRPSIVFSHANSFGAPTYRLMFEALRQRGFAVSAIDQFGHDPAYPVNNNWSNLVEHLRQHIVVQQAANQAQAGAQAQGQPVPPPVLVGHSLGGILSLMCAAQHPELALAVVMVDSPVLGGWMAASLRLAKKTSLAESFSPGKVSKARRIHWPSIDAALEHFQHKKAFAQWHPQVLRDYIEHGTVPDPAHPEHRILRFDRAIETRIYNTLPDNLDAMLKRHPLRCPVAFIGGTHSKEMKQVGMTMTDKVVKGRITMLDGGHLFPMEKPLATAAAIEANILNLIGL